MALPSHAAAANPAAPSAPKVSCMAPECTVCVAVRRPVRLETRRKRLLVFWRENDGKSGPVLKA
eukprot:2559469-Prymnesium_polylepis.1